MDGHEETIVEFGHSHTHQSFQRVSGQSPFAHSPESEPSSLPPFIFRAKMSHMHGHLCRSQSSTTLPESWADHPFPKLTRVHSSADIAHRYAESNSPTRYWPRNKPYCWPLTSNLCSIVSNYFYYPLFRAYWPSYRSSLLDTNWYNRQFNRYQYLPSDSYYSHFPKTASYYYWYHYPYFKRWYQGF